MIKHPLNINHHCQPLLSISGAWDYSNFWSFTNFPAASPGAQAGRLKPAPCCPPCMRKKKLPKAEADVVGLRQRTQRPANWKVPFFWYNTIAVIYLYTLYTCCPLVWAFLTRNSQVLGLQYSSHNPIQSWNWPIGNDWMTHFRKSSHIIPRKW